MSTPPISKMTPPTAKTPLPIGKFPKLSMPYAYIVAYDLKGDVVHYAKLWRELEQSYNWFHYLSSMWIVMRQETLVELAAVLRSHIYTDDRLIVMPAKGPFDGWLTNDAWEWLNLNVPKEW
jgi:hypothetical protein